MKYELHPACAAWPEMPADELKALADSIRARGLLEPLTLTPDGLLLDGRNRALACEMAGVTPETVVHDGDPMLFSLDKNRHRRHMNRADILLTAAALATRPIGSNQHEGGQKKPPSNAEAAAGIGEPETTFKAVKTLLHEGTPEEISAFRSGKAKLTPTVNAIRARNKPAEPASIPAPLPKAIASSPPTLARDRVQGAADRAEVLTLRTQVRDLEAKLWSARDKVDQLGMYLADKPQPKAEERPSVKARSWPLSRGGDEGLPPRSAPPRQLVEAGTDLTDDPAFALRKEEFEQWLVRRKEALEAQYTSREAELVKAYQAKVRTQVEARFLKEHALGRVFSEKQFMAIWRCLHPDRHAALRHKIEAGDITGALAEIDRLGDATTSAFRLLQWARDRLVVKAKDMAKAEAKTAATEPAAAEPAPARPLQGNASDA